MKKVCKRNCESCGTTRRTTNTDKPYVCKTCQKRRFDKLLYDWVYLKSDLLNLKDTRWYKIGRVLRLI